MERIKIRIPKCRVVVVENYLSEEVGDISGKMYFKELDEIRKINHILKQYYNFVVENYRQIPIVEASKCKYYYTDKQYEYGAIPSHLNEIVNLEVAKRIEETIGL